MKTAYFDCFSGISGDMCLGALLDVGASSKALVAGLKKLPITGYDISFKKVSRAGIRATSVEVKIDKKKAPARKFADIKALVGKAKLSAHIKDEGLAIFERMFKAEARVHGGRHDRIHLHELGAVDAVVDVMGALILLEELDVKRVMASPVNVGSGSVQTAHGVLPVPAPATIELLRGAPIYGSDSGFELTTPTGAAILTHLAEGFGPVPAMSDVLSGCGAGRKNIKTGPNVLRVLVGSGSEARAQVLCMVETNIDDMNPQAYEVVMEQLFKEGALDVWLEHIIMKKGRPAVRLSALCPLPSRSAVVQTMLKETTTLGVRYWTIDRTELARSIRTVRTTYGPIRYKDAHGEGVHKTAPEYEDVKRAAKAQGIPIVELLKSLSESSKSKQKLKKEK